MISSIVPITSPIIPNPSQPSQPSLLRISMANRRVCPWGMQARHSGYGSHSLVAEIAGKETSDLLPNRSNHRSYAAILKGATTVASHKGLAVPISKTAVPRIHGGNITVTIEESAYLEGIAEHQYNLIGKLLLAKGERQLTAHDLQRKLATLWGLMALQVTPLGRGFYEIHLQSAEDKVRIFAMGTAALKPGSLRLSQWTPDFDPNKQSQTNAQVWIQILNLPQEYWTMSILFSIASGVGFPLRFDAQTVSKSYGVYARILVDMDCAKVAPDKILVENKLSVLKEFFVDIRYEYLPSYCSHCNHIGHDSTGCRFLQIASTNGQRRSQGVGPESEIARQKQIAQNNRGREYRERQEGRGATGSASLPIEVVGSKENRGIGESTGQITMAATTLEENVNVAEGLTTHEGKVGATNIRRDVELGNPKHGGITQEQVLEIVQQQIHTAIVAVMAGKFSSMGDTIETNNTTVLVNDRHSNEAGMEESETLVEHNSENQITKVQNEIKEAQGTDMDDHIVVHNPKRPKQKKGTRKATTDNGVEEPCFRAGDIDRVTGLVIQETTYRTGYNGPREGIQVYSNPFGLPPSKNTGNQSWADRFGNDSEKEREVSHVSATPSVQGSRGYEEDYEDSNPSYIAPYPTHNYNRKVAWQLKQAKKKKNQVIRTEPYNTRSRSRSRTGNEFSENSDDFAKNMFSELPLSD